jgi:serine phosphatase RsbU (regulator of sigma subunit)
MRTSIKNKMVLAISSLIIVLFSLVAALFISEKKTELSHDIYLNSLAFSKLTAPSVIESYDLYLAQNSFVYFNREMEELFEQNSDIAKMMVISYSGNVVYDSSVDIDRKFEGDRPLSDSSLYDQLRSEHISIKALNGDVYYLDEQDGQPVFVDRSEKIIDPLEDGTRIDCMMIPADERFSVLYRLDYTNLDRRVNAMILRIIYLSVFGILWGFILALSLAKRITKPVKKLVVGAAGIAKGDFKTRVEIRSGDELEYLGSQFNKMAEDLEESMDAKIYKERVTHELKLAMDIQNQIIPNADEIPKIDGIDIAADLISAEEIGGDMYDFLATSKDRLLFYLGDVTGHGVPAGIVSSIASALFFGYSNDTDLQNIIVNVNRVLRAKTMTNMFMTLCLMEWNLIEQKFRYVSAGHEQLIHFKAKDGTVELTPAGGIALGMLPEVKAHLKTEEVGMEPGDFVVVYSDGIPEAWKNDSENYGIDRFLESVKKAGPSAKTAEELKKAILKDVYDFTAGHKQMDDITLIVVKKN